MKLRQMLTNNTQIESAIETGCNAANNFQAAFEMFNEQKKKHSCREMNIGSDHFSSITIMPGSALSIFLNFEEKITWIESSILTNGICLFWFAEIKSIFSAIKDVTGVGTLVIYR